MKSLTDIEKVAGAGFGAAGGEGIRAVLVELQNLKKSLVTGFAGGVSGAVTDSDGNSASAGGGDTLVSCIAHATNALPVDLTGSASFSNDRVLIADADTTGKSVEVTWFNQDGA